MLRGTLLIDPDGIVKALEIHDNSIGRSSEEPIRKLQAARFVREHNAGVCPANWKPGAETLTPGLDLVGKIWIGGAVHFRTSGAHPPAGDALRPSNSELSLCYIKACPLRGLLTITADRAKDFYGPGLTLKKNGVYCLAVFMK